MFHYAEKTVIALKPEQHRALGEIAGRKGLEIDDFIEDLLRTVIENQQEEDALQKHERICRNFDRIRQHRQMFLEKRQNQALSVDTVSLLDHIRDEHDEHAFSLLDPHHR